mmetsp:Transcript_31645/g.73165  ORF Transcript_31645/g.73165 Transcript_31645/m.73165 type:complete len:238 (-) Transcript_31645:39-752(-)
MSEALETRPSPTTLLAPRYLFAARSLARSVAQCHGCVRARARSTVPSVLGPSRGVGGLGNRHELELAEFCDDILEFDLIERKFVELGVGGLGRHAVLRGLGVEIDRVWQYLDELHGARRRVTRQRQHLDELDGRRRARGFGRREAALGARRAHDGRPADGPAADRTIVVVDVSDRDVERTADLGGRNRGRAARFDRDGGAVEAPAGAGATAERSAGGEVHSSKRVGRRGTRAVRKVS